MHTWIFVVQRAVMLAIREPDTPGGFSDSMPCKAASRSATGEDITRRQNDDRMRPQEV